jgi:hypothetical protein
MTLSVPPAGNEGNEVHRPDSDRGQDQDVSQLPAFTQLVHGRGAHPQPPGHIPHRQQLLALHTRKHRRSKTFGKPCVRLDPLDSTPAPSPNTSNNLRPAVTPCDAFPRFWEPDVAGSNPVAPTTQSGCDFGTGYFHGARESLTRFSFPMLLTGRSGNSTL